MLSRLHLCPDEIIAQFLTDETVKMRLVKAGKLVSDVSIQAIKRQMRRMRMPSSWRP